MAAEQLNTTQQTNQPPPAGAAKQPTLGDHYLQRLENLVRQREDLLSRGAPDAFQKKLLDRAIFATLTDCIQIGAGEQAQAIIDAHRASR